MKLTRRALLSSVAVLALAYRAAGQPNVAAFWGSPNVTITAIDTAGGITMPRGAGYGPFFAHVSASAISATGTTRPYEDLEYVWDFGDPDGTEIFVRPIDDEKVNANVQIGPEAVYCYRRPGTYTVTLNIRGCAALGADGKPRDFVAAKVTRNVTVAAFPAHGGNWYFDSAGGSDRNDGKSPSRPKQTLSAMVEAANIAGAAIHLKRGSSWTDDGKSYAALGIRQSPLRIDAYGAGPKPIITTNAHSAIGLSPTTKGFNDIVLSNLTLVCGPTSDRAAFSFVQSPNYCSYIYLDNVDMENRSGKAQLYFAYAGGAADPKSGNLGVRAWIGGGTWNCTAKASTQIPTAVDFGATLWMFHFGLTILADTKQHHINPENSDGHVLYRWVKTVGAIESDFFSFCIACRVREYTGAEHSFQLLTECYFEGGMDGIACNAPRHGPDSFLARAFIIERCSFNGLRRHVFYPAVLGEGTFRDNKFWKCDGGAHFAIGLQVAGYASGKCYRNRHFRTATPDDKPGRQTPAILLYPSKTGSLKWEITDNEIYDMRPGANAYAVSCNFSDHVRAGSLIDRNQYFAPNADGKVFVDNGTRKTFAQWQALGFDRKGRVAKPNWREPESGKF